MYSNVRETTQVPKSYIGKNERRQERLCWLFLFLFLAGLGGLGGGDDLVGL